MKQTHESDPWLIAAIDYLDRVRYPVTLEQIVHVAGDPPNTTSEAKSRTMVRHGWAVDIGGRYVRGDAPFVPVVARPKAIHVPAVRSVWELAEVVA